MGIYFGTGYGGGSLGSYGAGGGWSFGSGDFGSGLSYRSSDSYIRGTADYTRWLNQGINDYSAQYSRPPGSFAPPPRASYPVLLPGVPAARSPSDPPQMAPVAPPVTPIRTVAPKAPPSFVESILEAEISDTTLLVGLGVTGVILILILSGGGRK